MPDYIPAPQLPQGLAEALIRMKGAAGDPWASLAQNLGNDVKSGIQNYQAARANAPLTPEQQSAIGITSPAPGPVQPGQAPLTQRGGGSAFAGGMPRDLASQILQRQTQRDIARETTARMMGVQGLRNDSANNKVEIPVTDTTRALFKKAGLALDPNAQTVRHEDYEAALKSVLGDKSAAAKKDAAAISASGGAKDLQVDKFVQGEMDKANMAINPLNAKRGSVLGTSGMMKTRIATARDNLNDPNITPQQLASVATDLAGIVQMGTPHESGIKDQDYQTWWTKAKAISGRIANNPKAAESPETVTKLKEVLDGYDQVYNKVVNNNLDAHKASVKTMLRKYPAFKSAYDESEKSIRQQYPLDQKESSGSAFDDLYKKHGLQ